jgi:hypothetical protein
MSMAWILLSIITEAPVYVLPAPTESAREFATRFVEREFLGNGVRYELVKYTLERQKKETERDPELKGSVYEYQFDPLVVVSSFEVRDVRQQGQTAKATVVFRRLARTEGQGAFERRFIAEPVTEEFVELDLRFEGNQWWVYDPPLPHVSRDVLVRYYERELETVGNIVIPERAEAVKRLCRESLRLLRSHQ